jgi:hypothetical protein
LSDPTAYILFYVRNPTQSDGNSPPPSESHEEYPSREDADWDYRDPSWQEDSEDPTASEEDPTSKADPTASDSDPTASEEDEIVDSDPCPGFSTCE